LNIAAPSFRLPSFRLKIALLSTVLSGSVLLACGVLFLDQIERGGLARIDREMMAIGESLLKMDPFRPDSDVGIALDRSQRFIYGPEGRQRFILRVRDRSGELIYQSPDWPAAVDSSRLPRPRVRDPEPPWLRENPPPPSRPKPGEERPGDPRAPPPRPEPIASSRTTVRDGRTSWRVVLLVHPRGQLMLGRDLAELAAENARARNAFLLGAPLALLLLAGAGGWVAARALRPIEAITATARRITAQGLGERVPAVRADREIAQLIAVINGMLERLERSFRQAARFSADAAHELKTPLTILQGQLEEALQEAPDGSPAQRTLSDLLDEVQRLRAITRKLLLLAQADAGQLGGAALASDPIDWTARVQELVEDTRELAPNLIVTADLTPGLEIQGDQDLLIQLLQNLATNAIKFNRPPAEGAPGAIEIELKAQQGRALLSIANTGPSLTPEEQGRLFERFYRGDPAHNRRTDGVGLGLSLAREIAHAHGGELKVDTEREGWVRFTLDLETRSLPG
jgi:two-component system heavy metal sensor histidine kinase CusS